MIDKWEQRGKLVCSPHQQREKPQEKRCCSCTPATPSFAKRSSWLSTQWPSDPSLRRKRTCALLPSFLSKCRTQGKREVPKLDQFSKNLLQTTSHPCGKTEKTHWEANFHTFPWNDKNDYCRTQVKTRALISHLLSVSD